MSTKPTSADPVAIARDLIRCPSVTPEEGGALAYLQHVLVQAGFSVHRTTFAEPGTAPIENLYARVGTEQPNLVFAGHTDVSWRRGVIRRLAATSRVTCFTGVAPST
jgi:succinyl-diaminopimelate desuccinylase